MSQTSNETDAFADARRPPESALTRLSPLVRRIVAPNPSPFTFTGTCAYIVGEGRVAVIDPGPDDERHRAALLAATAGERIETILVTHTHRDHSRGAMALKAATGARLTGAAPFVPSAEGGGLEASHDLAYAPDAVLAEGERVEGPGYALEAVATPGHCANHLCFALRQEKALFSGDHVMAWSTSVVAPPDGSMRDYMGSLEKLRRRDDSILWPGHGGPVAEPQRYLRALLHHRRQREASILTALEAGAKTPAEIVERVYSGLAPGLARAAAMSTFAHLLDLEARGLVAAETPAAIGSRFRQL